MRRKDREVLDQTYFNEMFRKADVMTLAFNDGEYPYSVPLSFAAMDGALYFHCAREGRKLDCLKRDPHVHFSMYQFIGVNKELATVQYKSLMGTGIAEIVEERDEKQKALAAISQKYESKCELPVPEKMFAVTCLVRISITSLVGKKNVPA